MSRAANGVLTLCWLMLSTGNAQTCSSAGKQPAYQPFRYDEDWSCLTGDALKHIPLGGAPGWYVTIGGEIRERFELLDQPGFGVGPADRNGYFLQRYLLSFDFHLGSRLRVFTELQSGLENGRNGGPRPTDLDRLDLHQAFVDWKMFSSERNSVTLRAGRQEVGFGSGRLLSPAEGLNLRRSMDGARLLIKTGSLAWNMTALRLVKSNAGIFDDAPDHAQSLWGTGVTAPHPVWRNANMSVYYFGLDRKNSVFEKGLGRQIRHTAGSRSWKTSGNWDFNYEGIAQWGSFQGRPIRAWALSEDTGFTLRERRLRPRFGVRADIASGDGGPGTRALGSFDPLFAAAPVYSGPSGLLGPTNLIDLTPTMRVQLKQSISLTLELPSFWRESLGDGIYSPFVTPIRIGNANQSRYVATAPSATVTWQASRHVSSTIVYARFLTESFFREALPNRNVNYVAGWISYRF